MSKPAEIKKQARRLAQQGKIVDAIRVLEELAHGDSVDPYDLVVLGDLCTRGGRAAEATDYFARAVEAYRDAALHRNGIALCRKVLRLHPSENRFLLFLGELSEREGLVLDAVGTYLEYAETLDPSEATGGESWLEALTRLTPRNVETLTRQAELLVRWNRASDAAALLRYGADAAANDADRSTLLEMAEQMDTMDDAGTAKSALDPASNGDGPVDIPVMDTTSFESEALSGESFDQAYLRDLSFDPVNEKDSEAFGPAVEEEAPALESTAADEEPPVAEFFEDTIQADPGISAPSPEADLDLETASETALPSPEPDVPGEPTKVFEIDVEDTDLEETRFDLDLEPAGGPGTRPAAAEEALSLDDLVPTLEANAGPAPAESAQSVVRLREALEAALRDDPFNMETLQNLLVVYERSGDSHAALDLREQLARRFLEEGDIQTALQHLREILNIDPTRPGVQERYERLCAEFGDAGLVEEAQPASASPDEPGAESVARPDSTFNVQGLSKVEVRDEPSEVTEDDMVNLDTLLHEFRQGLKEGMADADPRAHYDLGLSHLEMGLIEEAVEAFETATTDPELAPEAREMLGRCLRQLGRTEDAIRTLHAALASRPESLGIRYQLALAHEEAGETGDALRFHQSILREDPDFEDSQVRASALGGPDCATQPPET